MRIVSRPDFDGIVCAALLCEAEDITEPVKWIQPSDIQNNRVDIRSGDIIANLPYNQKCSLWFDHHYTNRTQEPFNGVHREERSAARIIFEYYKNRFVRDYTELVEETDKIDSADLSMDHIKRPERYGYFILSMTIYGSDLNQSPYWDRLVYLLRKYDISQILENPDVKKFKQEVIEENRKLKYLLLENTRVEKHIAVTDFRNLDKKIGTNRFLVYSLFPEAAVSLKIQNDEDQTRVSVGRNIFNDRCKINLGLMLSEFGGGGHPGAGGCIFSSDKADQYIKKIINILLAG